ncbi:MAG: aspartate-semialdehyde dehydrogenase [Planctomycetota bacterium]
MSRYNIAIAGATGVVGRELITLLEEREFPCRSLRLLASHRSAGTTMDALGRTLLVEDLATADPAGLDFAFFCAGAERSRAFAPTFARAGAWVIDNSSAFRRDDDVLLIIPEINGHLLKGHGNRLIANPNCSTIAALMPLAGLQKAFGLDRVLVSSYQAVSGAGGAALDELMAQTRGAAQGIEPVPRVFPRSIVHNLIPWIGDVDETGFCEEERKIAFESRKILSLPKLKISATTVRVPVRRCHSLSIWVRLNCAADEAGVRSVLDQAPGVVLSDAPPSPASHEGADPVYVGRVRKDPDEPNAFWLWVVSDQLRKGAALNAIQIAEMIHETK